MAFNLVIIRVIQSNQTNPEPTYPKNTTKLEPQNMHIIHSASGLMPAQSP